MTPRMLFKANIEEFTGGLAARFSELAIDHGQMARDIQEVVGEETVVRAELEVAPSFRLWEPNDPVYRAWKGDLPIGVLTGEMLSPANLKGRITQADSDAVRIEYEGSDFARAKLRWFEASGRKVWGLDQYVRPRVKAIVGEYVQSSVKVSQTRPA